MDCSTPGLPVHHQLPEFTQTHVHWVGDAIQPSHPLSSPSPPTLNFSQHQGLLKWVYSFCEKCLFKTHKLRVKWSESHSIGPNFLQPHGLNSPWNFPGKNTGVSCYFLLQGIFVTQGSNLCLLHLLLWQADSLPAETQGKLWWAGICSVKL